MGMMIKELLCPLAVDRLLSFSGAIESNKLVVNGS
jgi:hypothetical protein